jgi:Arc/MetJ-type ribon-helix-helix transcriptional regulator
MTNVTVPLPESLLEFVDRQVDEHKADSRAGFIRRLIAEKRENNILEAHLEAVKEYREGKTLKGNLKDYTKKR